MFVLLIFVIIFIVYKCQKPSRPKRLSFKVKSVGEYYEEPSNANLELLMWAIGCGHLDIVQEITKDGEKIKIDNNMLVKATNKGQVEILDYWIHRGVKVPPTYIEIAKENAVVIKAEMNFNRAFTQENIDCLEWLIKEGFDVLNHNTLQIAVDNGQVDIITEFIRLGISVTDEEIIKARRIAMVNEAEEAKSRLKWARSIKRKDCDNYVKRVQIAEERAVRWRKEESCGIIQR